MGYFSALNIDYEDLSYPSPGRQLEMRFEDLKNRLSELKEKGAQFKMRGCYYDDDIRYIIPEHFFDIYHTQRAIELAKQDLFSKYGIAVTEDVENTQVLSDTAVEGEECYDPEQIALSGFSGFARNPHLIKVA